MSKRSRSENGKTPEFSSNPFVSQNASYRFSAIHNKTVISGKTVVLGDFEYLNLSVILSTSSLEHFVTIKEHVYPELVHYFTLTCLLRSIISGLEYLVRISTFHLKNLPICYTSPVRG